MACEVFFDDASTTDRIVENLDGQSSLEIIYAIYGPHECDYESTIWNAKKSEGRGVTADVRAWVKDGQLTLPQDLNALFGDPCPDTSKKLTIQFRKGNDEPQIETWLEHEAVTILPKCSSATSASVANKEANRWKSSTSRWAQSLAKKRRLQHEEEIRSSGSWMGMMVGDCLAMIIEALDLYDRLACCNVNSDWYKQLRKFGLATYIDTRTEMYSKRTAQFLTTTLRHSTQSLCTLVLQGCGAALVEESLTPCLASVTRLRHFDVSGCLNIGDHAISTLALNKSVRRNLRILYLKNLPLLTDDGIAKVVGPRGCSELSTLDVSGCTKLSDATLERISENMFKLHSLCLRDNQMSDNGFRTLLTTEPMCLCNLEVLTISNHRVTGSGALQYLRGEEFKNLRSLCFYNCPNLDSSALDSLKLLPGVRDLKLRYCHRLDDQSIVRLAASISMLEHLDLGYLRRLSDVAIRTIAERLQRLKSLNLLHCTQITDQSVLQLARLHKLGELKLYGCRKLTHEVAFTMTSCASMQLLDMRCCSFGPLEINTLNSKLYSKSLPFSSPIENLFIRDNYLTDLREMT